MYGLKKCRHFVLGCKDLIVITDHKPLLGVLNDRSLADNENRRLLLLKEKTLEFQFEIVHVPGRLNVGPDAMSRNPANVTAEAEDTLNFKEARASIHSVAIPINKNHHSVAIQTKETTDEIGREILHGLASIEAITAVVAAHSRSFSSSISMGVVDAKM